LPWIKVVQDERNMRFRYACIEPGTDVELPASNLFIAQAKVWSEELQEWVSEKGGLLRCSDSKPNSWQRQNAADVDNAFEHHGAKVSTKSKKVGITVKQNWDNQKSVSANDSNRTGKTPLKETLGLPFASKTVCPYCTFMMEMWAKATNGTADAEWPLSRFKGLEAKLNWMLQTQKRHQNFAFGQNIIQVAKVKVEYWHHRHERVGEGAKWVSPVALALDNWWKFKNQYTPQLPLDPKYFDLKKKRKQPEKPDGDEDMAEAEAGAGPEDPEDPEDQS
jgi:hypothetical protein